MDIVKKYIENIEKPKLQSGGTWANQQSKVKAEKDAKLQALLAQDKPVYKKKTIDEQIAEKKKQANTRTVEKDATNVRINNRPELTSKVARNKTDKEIAEERQARIEAQAKANDQPFDWSNFRQSLADRSQATGDALRISNEPNFFDDYINPAAMIGSMADNLGQAPLRAQQEDSFIPYVTAIGTPLTVGALAGLGTQNTGQFVNNLANPLAGTGDLVNNLGNKYLPNAYKLNPNKFTPNTDNFYHISPNYKNNIKGDELVPWGKGNKELFENKTAKPSGGINLFKTKGVDEIYFSKGVPLDGRYSPQKYEGNYLWEMPSTMPSVNKVNGKKQPFSDAIGSYKTNTEPMLLKDANLYEKDWLQGYKQVDNNVSNPLIPLYRGVQGQEEQPKPQFQSGGKMKNYTENEKKFLDELVYLKLI